MAELKAIKAQIAAEAVARTSAQVQDLLNEWSTDHEVKARVDAMLKEMGADTEAEATLLAKVAERFSRKRSDSSD